jgi:hypothetical protein
MIRGIEWKCISCETPYSLCFKCYAHYKRIHDADHEFDEIRPMYMPRYRPPSSSNGTSHDSGDELVELFREDDSGDEDIDDGKSESTTASLKDDTLAERFGEDSDDDSDGERLGDSSD